MAGCKATCQHYRFVRDYRDERERQLSEAEEAGNGYEVETAEYLQAHPAIVFKTWLIQHRREPNEES